MSDVFNMCECLVYFVVKKIECNNRRRARAFVRQEISPTKKFLRALNTFLSFRSASSVVLSETDKFLMGGIKTLLMSIKVGFLLPFEEEF